MIRKILIGSSLSLCVPFFSFAASTTLEQLVGNLVGYLSDALVLLMGVAVIVFAWNVFKYFVFSTEDHKAAAPYVLWSLVAFFAILSFWGLVNILGNTFGLQNDNNKPQSWTEFSNLVK